MNFNFSRIARGRDNSPHIFLIDQIANMLQPRVYVEVGIYECATLNRVAKHASTAIAIDVNSDSFGFVKRSNVVKVHGTTREAEPTLEQHSGQIDLVFIDGDHRIEAVRDDFDRLVPFVSPTAIILIHDTWPKSVDYSADEYCSDSFLFPSELNQSAESRWNAVTLPVHPGLTLVSKAGMMPPWYSSPG
jgi:predicted O-methyltransferase YrrM